ncbi:Nuclease-like protein [Candidatus Roizmanbacteria bacterium]|nr:Nuclease-like protein [Candidatus Roizmanbacteria bacterium]
MTRANKQLTIYVLAIIYAVIQLFFNKNNPLPKVSIVSTGVPTPESCRGQACLTQVKVIRIIDGDTIEIEGNKKVRYIGINTPELHDPRRPVGCFAQAASDENKRLVEGKEVYIQKDVSETDKYKRLLRYVWIGDPSVSSAEAIFVNDYLVRQGFAQVSTFPPDVKYQLQFLEAQKEAKINKLGLWKECPAKYL